MNRTPLLSICIPTWNRTKFLAMSLDALQEQLKGIDKSEIELFVSDNASDDNTAEVVQEHINHGMPITYHRNSKNLGAAVNFYGCMQWASGKYVYILGDDDVLRSGSVAYILDILRGKDYGIVHFLQGQVDDSDCSEIVYTDTDMFLRCISFWITFVSANIFRKDIVKLIDPEPYKNTHFLQLPFYVTSALNHPHNLVVRRPIMDVLDFVNNGGYHYHKVFVQNYLNIWKEFLDKQQIKRSTYQFLKRDIYYKHVDEYNYQLLIKHVNVISETESYLNTRCGYKVNGAWKILFKYYGYELYFYKSLLRYIRRYFREKEIYSYN